MKLYLSSPLETSLLASIFASFIKRGDILALRGDLGVGKSSFARALIRSLADNPNLEVPSPSFALVQTYEIKDALIYHYDLWRLDHPENIYELGWDDACEEIMIVEWPDRAEELLPSHAMIMCFSFSEEEAGRFVEFHNMTEEKYHKIVEYFHQSEN